MLATPVVPLSRREHAGQLRRGPEANLTRYWKCDKHGRVTPALALRDVGLVIVLAVGAGHIRIPIANVQ
jgi:hypothetical protein